MIKGGEEMKTNIIFNTMAFVMLLSTACSNENINDNNAKEGYTMPPPKPHTTTVPKSSPLARATNCL